MSDELELELGQDDGEEQAELSAEELRAALEEARREAQRAADTAKQLGEQNEKLTSYITEQYVSQFNNNPQQHANPTPTPTVPRAGEEPDRDEDPEAWMEWKIAKGVEQAVEKVVKPLEERYTRDRSTMLSSASASAKRQVAEAFPDFAKYSRDIETYLSSFGADAMANPAAWEEAFYRIKGRAVALAEREAATRESAASDGRGRPSASASAGADAGPPPNPLSGRAERFARHEKMSEKDWADFSSSSMSIDDYVAMKAKREKNKRRVS